jgi:hypothetical protein
MESHDEQWLMLKMRARFGNRGAGILDARTRQRAGPDEDGGRVLPDRTGPAHAMAVQRSLAMDSAIGSASNQAMGRTETASQAIRAGHRPKPIRWSYYAEPLQQKLYRTWSELLRLRADHGVFRDIETEVSLNTAGPVKFITLRHEEMDVVIVGNFDVNEREVNGLISRSTGTWYDFFEGTDVPQGGRRAQCC